MDIQPFKIQVSGAVLEDLRERLARTRWPDEIPGSDWDYGSDLAYIKELAEYWRTGFDWRAQERSINAFAQFRATIGGLGIHFIHERGKETNSLPLVITHGWPGSLFEMLKIIPLLTDPVSHGADPIDSFDVVAISQPGMGFSSPTTQQRMNDWRIANVWAQLMTEGLGYGRFGAHGADGGAGVTSRLGYIYPEQVIGIHITSVGGASPYIGSGARPLSRRERGFLEEKERWRSAEGGYAHIQGTKPQTLSYGLNDSPAGLAAWIVEKTRSLSDRDGDVEWRFSKDELLTNITIYWVTQTINSSSRLFYEDHYSPWVLSKGERVRVQCAVALFAKEMLHPPREWVERSHNVQRWTEMPRGGHFPWLEEPELLAEDLRAFFRPLRG